MKERIAYLDFLKFFAIFSVLLGHSVEQISADLFWDHPLWTFIYSYHMPLFMFLCGLFFKSSLKKSFDGMFVSKFKQLIIPSMTAFAITVVIMICSGVRAIADLCELSFNGFMNTVWFLKCVFFCYVIMYPICRLFKNIALASIVASVLILLIPGAQIVNLNFMLPMFCLGIICGEFSQIIEKYRTVLTTVSGVLFAVMLIFWSGRLTVYMVPTNLIVGGSFDPQNCWITLYRLAIGAAGTLFFYLISKPLYESLFKGKTGEFLCNIGKETMGIYLLQTFSLEIAINSLHIFIPIPQSYWAAPIIAVVELLLCYSIVLMVKKTKILRLMLLGK